jgi:GMP synthase (glutamine-hydrolysing)
VPQSAFSRGPNVIGLQFHPEVRGARFEHWLLGHASELATSGIDPVTLRRDAKLYANDLEKAGAILLDQWLEGIDQ